MPNTNEELMIEAKSFFETYKKEIGESIRKGKRVVFVNFEDLSSNSPDLAEALIANPEEMLEILETALEGSGLIKTPRIRFNDLPETQKVKIRTIRANHLNKLIYFEGLVRQASEVRPQVVNAKFECPSCGTVISVLQIEKKFREPSRCSCGRKGQFRLMSKTMVDAQRLVIEESPEALTGGEQPRRMSVFLKEDLVEPGMEEKTTPGSKVRILGVLKEVPVPLPSGAISTRFDLAIEANNIIPLESTYEDLDISEEDEMQIEELAADPELFKKLRDSIAPSIWGYEEIKEALVLQMFSGVRKISSDGAVARGDIHLFLMGDPGVAKSLTLKFIADIAPKGRYIVGKAASLEHNEPLLIRENKKQKFVKIGDFINSNYKKNETGFIPCNKEIEALSFNLKDLKFEWKPIRALFRHKNKENLLKFSLETGRKITITKDHSIYCLNKGKIICKPSQELKKSDYVVIPMNISSKENNFSEEIARFLGYFIAEGHLYNKDGSYKVQFTLNKNEEEIISDINNISKTHLKKPAKTNPHGENGIRVTIYGKEPYLKVCSWLGELAHKKAKEKGVPELILNSNKKARKAFFDSYMKGDYGVTKSERLMSELLYLNLQDKVVASCLERDENKRNILKNGREIIGTGMRFDLIAPIPRKKFQNTRLNFPIKCLSKNLKKYFKRKSDQRYNQINLKLIGNNTEFVRIQKIYENNKLNGKNIRKLFGENSLEYFINHKELYHKEKIGRGVEFSLTKKGLEIGEEIMQLKKLLESDITFVKIKNIKEIKSKNNFVYDISIEENENFVAGFGGILCHNSGAGITATVVRDEFLKGWSLEAGAMVLANKGIICIDEIEKMDASDRSAMHEALEQQTVTISKANVQACLSAQTSVLAAGNPKFGRFEPTQSVAQQIDLPPALINRFDLIFILRDLPNKAQDDAIATHVLNMHQKKGAKSAVDRELFRKYVAYAKQKIEPALTESSVDEIKNFYVKLRNMQSSGDSNSIAISARQLQGLVRLAEAHAKSRLSLTVEKEDSQVAIRLTNYYLMQVGYDPETKKFDIDRFTSRISSSQRSKLILLKESIKKLEQKYGKQIPIDVLKQEMKDMPDIEFDESIEKLKKSGDIFQPKQGFVQDVQSR